MARSGPRVAVFAVVPAGVTVITPGLGWSRPERLLPCPLTLAVTAPAPASSRITNGSQRGSQRGRAERERIACCADAIDDGLPQRGVPAASAASAASAAATGSRNVGPNGTVSPSPDATPPPPGAATSAPGDALPPTPVAAPLTSAAPPLTPAEAAPAPGEMGAASATAAAPRPAPPAIAPPVGPPAPPPVSCGCAAA